MLVRKRFGQHFLHDKSVIGRIVDAVAPTPGERVVEIGPGRGALTWALLQRAGTLDAIEIDRDLAQHLASDARAGNALRIHQQDVLDTDFIALRGDGPPLRIVGNLPYNISTPILFHLLDQHGAIADMHFMLQREVVERMSAEPHTKQYGRLTVMLAAITEVEHLFDVGPGSFRPPPKVWSAIVRLTPSAQPRFAAGAPGILKRLTTAAFSQRRKTLRNALKQFLEPEVMTACGVDPQARPETLTPQQFGMLAAQYSRLYSDANGEIQKDAGAGGSVGGKRAGRRGGTRAE
jgi:16S rRNA (adenine1518-N6/adenine1519-N6)-dimethyltransferase